LSRFPRFDSTIILSFPCSHSRKSFKLFLHLTESVLKNIHLTNCAIQNLRDYIFVYNEVVKLHNVKGENTMSGKMKTYRVGIAGAGAFATFLSGALARLPEFQLTAVAGRTDTKRESVMAAFQKQRHNAITPKEYYEAADLIADPEIDIVILATPPHLHSSLSRLALTHGKHVLLEKPGALYAKELLENANYAKKQKRAFAVNLVLRYNPLVEAVEWIVRHRLLGFVHHASLTNSAHHVANGHWFWNDQLSGGIFIEHGVHFFEVGRHLLGEAVDANGFALTEENGEKQRVWASVLHKPVYQQDEKSSENNIYSLVPVQYYHGFTMDPDAPESTKWEIHCTHGRIVLEGWIPQKLFLEGKISKEQGELIDQILDSIPKKPVENAVEKVRSSAFHCFKNKSFPLKALSSISYERTIKLEQRQLWYEAMVQDRFLDFCRIIEEEGWEGFVTAEDAVKDLELANRVTFNKTEQPLTE